MSARAGLAAGVVVALLVGLFARVQGLDKPIWHDEVYTRIFAAGRSSADWIPALYQQSMTGPVTSRDAVLAFQRLDPDRGPLATLSGLARDEPQHTPAYYVLARAWMALVGDELAALRALSVLASLLALGAGFWFAREAFGGLGPWGVAPPVALMAASPFLAFYAQEAREYALWTVFILGSSAALLRALRRDTEDAPRGVRARAWALYAGFTAAGLFTSLSHTAVILAQVAALVHRARSRQPRPVRAAALALIAAGLLFLPWAWLVFEHRAALSASMAWSRDIVVPASEVLGTLAVNLSRPLLDLWPAVEGIGPGAAVAAVCGLVVVAFVDLARRGPPQSRTLLVWVAVVPIVLFVVPDLAFGGIRSFSTRYLTPALLMALFAVGHRLATLASPRARVLAVCAIVAVALAGAVRTTADTHPWPRGLSAGLPEVAAAIDAAPRPLVLADRERHHPGNTHALATLVGPATDFLLLDFAARDALVSRAAAGTWVDTGLPADRPVFLFGPVPQLYDALTHARGRPPVPILDTLHVSCWRFDP